MEEQGRVISIVLVTLVISLLAGVMIRGVVSLPTDATGLTQQVDSNLERSGVENPVTAVLLNFRGYDTWLELGVLLLAVWGVLGVHRASNLSNVEQTPSTNHSLLWLVRWLTPAMVLVAGYLLWLGKFAAGGAFQSGVLLAVVAVLLWFAGFRSLTGISPILWKATLLVGFVGFALAGSLFMLLGRRFLEFSPDTAGTVILWVEAAAAISIGATFAGLFFGLQRERYTDEEDFSP
ncbi:MAG: Na(+)/H(+) antiporter subunit B [Verrucomicrobia bacterium]|nr:Na(+)/H(+) antiporter subunit B [Verrucomicrobiota bacterium]